MLKIDSLKISHRIGGENIDSISDYNAGIISLNPGGYKNNPFGTFQNNYSNFLNPNGVLSNQFRNSEKNSFKYSSLPHLGFQYSFGSKGIQILRTEYEQFFSKKFGLNILIDRSSLGEMMRSGTYKNNTFQFSTYYKGNRYKNYTFFEFNNSNVDQNGGLDTASSSVKLFPLEFLAVNKSKANSELKNLKISSQHYFNLLNDSINNLGLVLKNDFKLNNRVYTETDSIHLIYENVFFDSINTRDQFQFAKLNSQAGIYLKNKNIFGEFLISHAYWDFQNLAKHLDTNEIALNFNARISLSKFVFSNKTYVNLIGAKGEMYSKFKVNTSFTNIKLNGYFDLENKLPSIFQRKYYSNTNQWYLKDIKTQNSILIGISGEYLFKNKHSIKSSLNFSSLKNNYFFVDSTWRNDTLKKLSILSFDLKADFRIKSLIFQPYIIVNQFSAALNYIPKIDFRTRIGFNKKLFKAQKMDFICAVDFAYQGSRKLMTYASDLDLYILNSTNNSIQFTNSSLYKIDFFTGFQIDQFRFYIKTENLNYIWNKQDSFVFENVPLTPFLIRIGLTWDFFN